MTETQPVGALALIAENLACQRGGRTVFETVSFAVKAGQSLLLTGPNGAGKTSLLRIVAGLIAPAGGVVRLYGAAADEREADQLTLGQRSHYLAHTNAIKTALTVAENVAFWARFCGTEAMAERAAEKLSTFDLARHAHIPAELLSAGQRRRLGLTRLAVVPRPLWLLDEPTVGLDAASIAALEALMKSHLSAGGLILASSHVDFGIAFDHRLDLAGRTT